MIPTEIKKLLEENGLRPIKDRGQNFLLDRGVVEKMADAADIQPSDKVLEIGPGLGMLTEVLLERGAQVLAVELDLGLARILRERLTSESLEILEGDFLSFSNEKMSTMLGAGEGSYKVVANLPYAITSDALKKMLVEQPRPASVTVLIQREVVQRATAKPPKTSMLSLVVSTYGKPKTVVRVPAGSFWPKPKVESAALHISLYSSEEMSQRLQGLEPEEFLSVVGAGFAEKRKQLKNTLGRKYGADRIAAALQTAQIDPQERPERLTFERWVTVVKSLLQ